MPVCVFLHPIFSTQEDSIKIPGYRFARVTKAEVAMFATRTCTLPAVLFLLLGYASSASSAAGQQKSMKDQLIGTWKLVSITDDARNNDKPLRPAVKYITTFEPGGRVTFELSVTETLKKPDGDPRLEDRTAVFSGKYAVNEADRTVIYKMDRGSSWLLHGDPKIIVTIKGEQFEQLSHPVGSPVATRAVWQRVN